MQRFHFHVEDGREYPDLQGTMLVDLTAARQEALRFAGQLLADADSSFWTGEKWTVTVTDDAKVELFVLTFMAADTPAVALAIHEAG